MVRNCAHYHCCWYNHLMINVKKFVKDYWIIAILALCSTAFFIYQHSVSLSWDFNSYVLNAKYWFAQGLYFETLRPPLVPLIMGLFSPFGWRTAEYLFIVFSSLCFAYSSVRLAHKLDFNPVVFYMLSLTPYLLFIGMNNGTELVSVAFLELAISCVLEGNILSGFFLGLSALSRYTALFLFPILFFHLRGKKIVRSIVIFFITLLPWFIYNFFKFGNFFFSIADQYANNILFRLSIHQAPQLDHFLRVVGILSPVFIIGFLAAFFFVIRQFNLAHIDIGRYLKTARKEIIMFFILVYTIYSYWNIPLKEARYLFTLVLPVAFFSYIGASYCLKKLKINKQWLVAVGILILLVNSFLFFRELPVTVSYYEKPADYQSAIQTLKNLNLGDCSVMSNSWVMLNYLGQQTQSTPASEMVNDSIREGKTIVLFKRVQDPSYVHNSTFISSFPVIYNDPKYILLGTKACAPITSLDQSFLEKMSDIAFRLRGYHTNTNPCLILFHNSATLERSCNFVNFKGYIQDSNRKIW